MTGPAPRVSVAIPLYNEEVGIHQLLARVCAVLDSLPGGPHELVLVDDGSTDHTIALLEAASREEDRLVILKLSRNFGHQAALSAALDHVTGDVTMVLDGDLQDPPELIPQFLQLYAEGNDVVYAQRLNRKESWVLRAVYFCFYRAFDRLSSTHVPLDAGDFGLISRRVVDLIRRMPERHRYIRGMRSWLGFRQAALPVDRPPRYAGTTKYTWRRLLNLAFDGIFAFSIVPIRTTLVFGVVAVSLSVVFGLYALYAKMFMGGDPRGFTALTLLIIFLSGVNLFFLGIIGEYVGRVYEQSKGRPIYVIDRIVRNQMDLSRDQTSAIEDTRSPQPAEAE